MSRPVGKSILRALATRPSPIQRAACAFDGCPCPPYVASHSGSGRIRALCSAHEKQKERGSVLTPVRVRSDLDKRWEEWAQRRAERLRRGSPKRSHDGCGGPLRVLATHSNVRDRRVTVCRECRARVVVEPDGSQRVTSYVGGGKVKR